jgi:hypothetical protein
VAITTVITSATVVELGPLPFTFDTWHVKVPAVSASGSKSATFARWHMKLNLGSLSVFEGSGLM